MDLQTCDEALEVPWALQITCMTLGPGYWGALSRSPRSWPGVPTSSP